jgi:hypothetical protein
METQPIIASNSHVLRPSCVGTRRALSACRFLPTHWRIWRIPPQYLPSPPPFRCFLPLFPPRHVVSATAATAANLFPFYMGDNLSAHRSRLPADLQTGRRRRHRRQSFFFYSEPITRNFLYLARSTLHRFLRITHYFLFTGNWRLATHN